MGFPVCLTTALICLRRCSFSFCFFTAAWNAFSIDTLSWDFIVSATVALSFSALALRTCSVFALRAISFGHTISLYVNRALLHISAEGNTTANSRKRHSKNLYLRVTKAARKTFSPLLSDTPAVIKNSTIVCHIFSALPLFSFRPQIYSVSVSQNSDITKWSGTIVASITYAIENVSTVSR